MVQFVRLPPDSTGKRIRHISVIEMWVISEAIKPDAGDVLTGLTSGATGIFVGAFRKTQITYFMGEVTGAFTAGEQLRRTSDNAIVSFVDTASEEIFTPSLTIADANVPANTLAVDSDGAANVRFSEGSPQFDAYGRIQVSQMNSVAEYYFTQEDQAGRYWQRQTGLTGVDTYQVQESNIRLQLGTTLGDRISRTTNQYHPYKPGTSQLAMIGTNMGDTGKADVVRQWGYFDDFNGVGFRLNGTTLQVFLRSDKNGVTSEEVIDQANWSGFRLNNLALFDFVLDVSKSNTYWLDISFSRIRLGVLAPTGERIMVHEFELANSNVHLTPRTFNLPLRWSMHNSGTSASTSEMFINFGVVFNEVADVKYSGTLIHTSPPDPITIPKDGAYHPFLSFRAKLTINGLPNRIIGIHEDFDWCAIGNSPIHVGIFVVPDATYMTGDVWSTTIVPSTMLEVDRSATSFDVANASLIESFIAGPNSSGRIRLGDRMEKSFGLAADGVSQACFVFAAKALDVTAVGDSKLFYTKYWKEIR